MSVADRIATAVKTASVWGTRVRTIKELAAFRTFAKTSLVTMDIFDTALRRSVARPKDVFLLAAYRLQQRRDASLDPRRLARLRESSESRARVDANGDEVTLDEIYALVTLDLGEELASEFKAEELATEKDVCHANLEVYAIYQELQRRGKPVAFISDTYLPLEFIVQLLEQSGYRGSHKVFVSNTFKSTKATGKLFPALKEHVPSGKQITHFGDNITSDVLNARRAGWNGFWYSTPLPTPPKPAPEGVQDYLRSSLEAGIAHALPSTGANRVWHSIGISTAWRLYLGFAQWIREQVRMAPVDRIYFCARDGKIVKKAYDLLRAVEPELPPSTYLMISRRSLVFSSFDTLGEDELHFLEVNGTPLEVAGYLTRIGLVPEQCRPAVEAEGLLLTTVVQKPDLPALRKVFLALGNEVLAVARAEKKLLLKYLEEQGGLSAKRIAFCDIGWHGSLQRAFAKVVLPLNPECQIAGYYVGTSKSFETLQQSFGSVNGWLLNNGGPAKRRAVMSGLAVLELLFTAGHGSVLGYRQGAQSIEPVLHETPAADEYATAAVAIQTSALEFARRYVKAFGSIPSIAIGVDEAFQGLRRLVETPSRSEAAAIGDLTHVDGFGSTAVGRRIAKPPTLQEFLTKPALLKRRFKLAHWPFGYLGRIAGPTAMTAILSAWRRARGKTV